MNRKLQLGLRLFILATFLPFVALLLQQYEEVSAGLMLTTWLLLAVAVLVVRAGKPEPGAAKLLLTGLVMMPLGAMLTMTIVLLIFGVPIMAAAPFLLIQGVGRVSGKAGRVGVGVAHLCMLLTYLSIFGFAGTELGYLVALPYFGVFGGMAYAVLQAGSDQTISRSVGKAG